MLNAHKPSISDASGIGRASCYVCRSGDLEGGQLVGRCAVVNGRFGISSAFLIQDLYRY